MILSGEGKDKREKFERFSLSGKDLKNDETSSRPHLLGRNSRRLKRCHVVVRGQVQLNPALTDFPPTEFRLKWFQINNPIIMSLFIFYMGSKRVTELQNKIC